MLLLLTATEEAADSIRPRLRGEREVEVIGVGGVAGRWAGVDVAVHAVGTGRAAAAFALSRLLVDPPVATILAGTAPAYPDTGAADGELVVATADTYAELGQETAEGLLDMASLGIRVAPGAPGQTFLCDPRLVDVLRDRADRVGAFLTTETATTRPNTVAGLVDRWGPALTETREGAAVAHACLLESVPMGHLRAIRGAIGSSRAGDDRRGGPIPDRLLDALEAALPEAAEALAHPFS